MFSPVLWMTFPVVVLLLIELLSSLGRFTQLAFLLALFSSLPSASDYTYVCSLMMTQYFRVE